MHLLSLHACYMPHPFHPPWLDLLIVLDEAYNLRRICSERSCKIFVLWRVIFHSDEDSSRDLPGCDISETSLSYHVNTRRYNPEDSAVCTMYLYTYALIFQQYKGISRTPCAHASLNSKELRGRPGIKSLFFSLPNISCVFKLPSLVMTWNAGLWAYTNCIRPENHFGRFACYGNVRSQCQLHPRFNFIDSWERAVVN